MPHACHQARIGLAFCWTEGSVMPAIKQELALRSAGRKGAIARLNAGLSAHTHAHLSVNWFIYNSSFVESIALTTEPTSPECCAQKPHGWREAHSKGTGVEWPVPNQVTYIG
ncbi:hypothetical protein MHU86_14847 [Fragilaria crotonensis]|nr:hypothetical protein MHU86_14847 [Fragilaria crotonensis]